MLSFFIFIMEKKGPLIIINFKSYGESSGKNAYKLAKICDDVSEKTDYRIMVAVQPADIYPITCSVRIPVLAQHVDFQYGKFTGTSVAQSVKDAGAWGTLLNHAEKKLSPETLKKSVEECKRVGLTTVICAADMNEVNLSMPLNPDYIAYEIPELIGSGKSITDMSPNDVRKFSEIFEGKSTIPLCGAGVSKRDHLRGAIEMGMGGVLLASGITQAKDPKKALEEMVGLA